jgi:hypothetical protein
MPDNLNEEEQKRIIKEAIKEWLDEQFAAFGKRTFLGLISAFLAAIVLFIVWANILPRR